MLILAMESSSPAGGVALVQDGRLLDERKWDAHGGAGGEASWACLNDLLAGVGVGLQDVDRFVVGTGPGSYTSLRMSAASVCSMALPGSRPTHGVSSAALVAWEALSTRQVKEIVVFGDARRGRAWAGVLGMVGPWPSLKGPFRLLDWRDLGVLVEQVGHAVTSMEERSWRECLGGRKVGNVGVRSPEASSLGSLAWQILAAGGSLPPAVPIYLQPAVVQGVPGAAGMTR